MPSEASVTLTTRERDLDRDTSMSSRPLLSLREPNLISIGSSAACACSPLATAWMADIHSSLHCERVETNDEKDLELWRCETSRKWAFTSPRCSPRERFARWRWSTGDSGSWRCWVAVAPSSSADTLESHDDFYYIMSDDRQTNRCIYTHQTNPPQRSYWAELNSDRLARACPCSRWRIHRSLGWNIAASRSLYTHLSHAKNINDNIHRSKSVRCVLYLFYGANLPLPQWPQSWWGGAKTVWLTAKSL